MPKTPLKSRQTLITDYYPPELLTSFRHHPGRGLAEHINITNFLHELWRYNFSNIGEEASADLFFARLVDGDMGIDEAANLYNSIRNAPRFKQAERAGRKVTDNTMLLNTRLTEPYLKDARSLIDFGCGRMAFLRRLVRENTSLKQIYGYDPNARVDYIDFDRRVEFISDAQRLGKLTPVDVIYSSFVLHHMTSDELEETLAFFRRKLAINGRIVLLEETFPEKMDSSMENEGLRALNEAGYVPNSELNRRFMALPVNERLLTIYLNDILMNLNNLDYMPWTYGYRTMDGWRSVFESAGLKVKEEAFLGVIQSGKQKQGLTGMIVL